MPSRIPKSVQSLTVSLGGGPTRADRRGMGGPDRARAKDTDGAGAVRPGSRLLPSVQPSPHEAVGMRVGRENRRLTRSSMQRSLAVASPAPATLFVARQREPCQCRPMTYERADLPGARPIGLANACRAAKGSGRPSGIFAITGR